MCLRAFLPKLKKKGKKIEEYKLYNMDLCVYIYDNEITWTRLTIFNIMFEIILPYFYVARV
jgi:hypothetical protein